MPAYDQRPPGMDTGTMENVVESVIESARVSLVMRAKEPSSPTNLASNNLWKSNNPFRKWLQAHEWYPQ